MTNDEPWELIPQFKDYLWGGTRLSERLGKPTGPGCWAESWEVVDHPTTQSLIKTGPQAGRNLHEVLQELGPEVLGAGLWAELHDPKIPAPLRGRFPLLIKFLDAAQTLSVQVHPNDEQGSRISPPDRGKTEAWYVLESTPGSRIFAGLRPGVTPSEWERALAAGQTEMCLHSFEPQPGDCVLIPAGTVHAIGGGLLILEVQQASDTTYRVFDWNRVDNQGRGRPLHIAQAQEVIDWNRGAIHPQPRANSVTGERELVRSPYFAMSEICTTTGFSAGRQDRFEILVVVNGALTWEGRRWNRGQTLLLPAGSSFQELSLGPDSTVLRIWVPQPGE